MKPEAVELSVLFDVARHGDEPSEADRHRVTARVAERLALGAGVGAAAFTVTRLSWAASLKTWSVVAVAVAGVSSGAYFLGAPTDVVRPRVAPSALHAAAKSVPRPVTALPPAPIAAPAQEVPVEAVPVRRERASVAPSSASPTATLEPGRLARETAALRSANEALRGGSAARALTLLDAFGREFPNGVLTQEALATRVAALCALGRVGEARALGSRFVQRYPRSPVAARVRGSCAAAGE